jgi:sphingosine kinase
MFLICKGKTASIDLSTYQTISRSYTAFLSYAYGFVADCDLESEILHFLGPIRTDIWAVWRILNLRHYRVRLSYLPPQLFSGDDSSDSGTTTGSMPPLDDALPENQGWRTMEDEIITMWACQTSHASFNLHSSPDSMLDDGLLHILLVRAGSCSRWGLVQMFLKIETGEHIHLDQVEVIQCRAFRLEPVGGSAQQSSFNDVDGEAVEGGTIQGIVNPKAMKMFAAPK